MNPAVQAVVADILTVLQLVVTAGSVIGLIVTLIKTAKKPNKTQNDRLDALETWKERVDTRLQTGNEHFEGIDKGERITQEALLALMQHAINGNDVDSLKRAKKKLEAYLIEK